MLKTAVLLSSVMLLTKLLLTKMLLNSVPVAANTAVSIAPCPVDAASGAAGGDNAGSVNTHQLYFAADGNQQRLLISHNESVPESCASAALRVEGDILWAAPANPGQLTDAILQVGLLGNFANITPLVSEVIVISDVAEQLEPVPETSPITSTLPLHRSAVSEQLDIERYLLQWPDATGSGHARLVGQASVPVMIALESGALPDETHHRYTRNQQSDLPGQAFAFNFHYPVPASDYTFEGDVARLNSVADELVHVWQNWSVFAGIAIHGLDDTRVSEGTR